VQNKKAVRASRRPFLFQSPGRPLGWHGIDGGNFRSPASRHLDALGPDAIVRFPRRLSAAPTVGLTLLVATGICNAWNELGHFSSLWTSACEHVLDIKLGLTFVMAGIGFGNRYRRVPALVHACRAPASHQAGRRKTFRSGTRHPGAF